MDRTENTGGEVPIATASFVGHRWGLFGVLLPGYLMILLTLGIYRFWQVTDKRHYYWGHTSIDSDALEYSGTATQLLVGFLIALTFFLPLYVLFFYLSTQAPDFIIYGYLGAAVFLYFLAGYANYRARRFRLSRTFWRGIRFGQSGNAWSYAIRRFLWSILVLVSAGLAYPFMAASLWRYRYANTWYGDRKFEFDGSWRTVAAPFYVDYFIMALLVGASAYLVIQSSNNVDVAGGVAALLSIPVMLAGGVVYVHLKSRFVSRFLSTITAGRARLRVQVKARSFIWMYLFYALLFCLVSALFVVIVMLFFNGLMDPLLQQQELDMAQVAQLGWANILGLGLIYLALLAAFGALAETVLGLGYWRMLVRAAQIENPDDLQSVRAHGEESPVTGEGLADALNVGAY